MLALAKVQVFLLTSLSVWSHKLFLFVSPAANPDCCLYYETHYATHIAMPVLVDWKGLLVDSVMLIIFSTSGTIK